MLQRSPDAHRKKTLERQPKHYNAERCNDTRYNNTVRPFRFLKPERSVNTVFR